MKLLAYTIGGQTIGIDIITWSDSMLSGNTAFLAIADTGSTPTDYVDISSIINWDTFGGTTATEAEIKNEIIKLIPDTPTPEQYLILEDYATVGLNALTNIDDGVTFGSILTGTTFLTGVTDSKLATSGDTASTLRVWEVTGSTGQFEDVLRINGKFYAEWIKNIRTASRAVVLRYDDTTALVNTNIAGLAIANPSGGTPFTGGSATMYWIGVDKDGITRAGWEDEEFKALLNGAVNKGTGEGLAFGVTGSELQIKSLVEGTNITLTSDADSITIDAAGGGSGVYGTEFQLASALAETTTTSATPQTKVTLTTTDLPSGTYKIFVAWIGGGSAPNADMIYDVTLNGTPQGTNATMNIESKDSNTHNTFSRTFYLPLSGVNDIALRYSSENSITTRISDATIELIRAE